MEVLFMSSPSEEYNEFYEWLCSCYQQDEEDIFELKLTHSQIENLLDFLIENCI